MLDVAAHIGLCTGKGRMPADRVRDGLGKAHAEFLRGAGSVRTTSCTHCDAPPPAKSELRPEAAASFKRALLAEPKLQAVSDVVEVLRLLVRPTDEMCHGCLWESIIKPLTTPLIGWGRGYLPRQAEDPDPTGECRLRVTPASEILMEAPTRAMTETENGSVAVSPGTRSPRC